MMRGRSLSLGLLALALSACGGNGGGGGGNTTAPLGLTSVPRIEAVLASAPQNPQDQDYLYQDPLGIVTEEAVVFQLVTYDDAGNRHVVPATFTTNDASSQYGTLLADDAAGTATFTASNVAVPNTTGVNDLPIITARSADGLTYTGFYRTSSRQTTVALRGKVVSDDTAHTPVYNATIRFFRGTELRPIATVHSAVDGTFRAAVPSNDSLIDTNDDGVFDLDETNAATKIYFTVDSTNLPSGFYPSFRFRGDYYDAGSTLCKPILASDTVLSAAGDPVVRRPFRTGDSFLVSSDPTQAQNPVGNGTIVLVPTSVGAKPDATGCQDGSLGN